jgi:hypothetical protein
MADPFVCSVDLANTANGAAFSMKRMSGGGLCRPIRLCLYFPTVLLAVCVMLVGSELVRLASWLVKE